MKLKYLVLPIIAFVALSWSQTSAMAQTVPAIGAVTGGAGTAGNVYVPVKTTSRITLSDGTVQQAYFLGSVVTTVIYTYPDGSEWYISYKDGVPFYTIITKPLPSPASPMPDPGSDNRLGFNYPNNPTGTNPF